MLIVAWFDTKPVASLTVYGIGVGSPVKPACGVNVTLPLGAAVQVPWPATTSVVCWPARPGFRSTVLTSKSLFDRCRSCRAQRHRPAVASELSLFATGGCCCSPPDVAGLDVLPSLSWTVYWIGAGSPCTPPAA